MNDHHEVQCLLAKYLAYAQATRTCHIHRIGAVPMLVSPAGIQVLDCENEPLTHRPVGVDLAAILVQNW